MFSTSPQFYCKIPLVKVKTMMKKTGIWNRHWLYLVCIWETEWNL